MAENQEKTGHDCPRCGGLGYDEATGLRCGYCAGAGTVFQGRRHYD